MEDASKVFAGGNLEFGQLDRLQEVTELAYASANKRLVSILFDKFNLLRHCLALKKYLLLGQVSSFRICQTARKLFVC